MAYTGGNSGYVRRLGKIPSTTPSAPTEPVAGYSAWFDASEMTTLFQDAAGTVPVTAEEDPVGRWASRGGSYGSLFVKTPGGYGLCRYVTNATLGKSVVQSNAGDQIMWEDTDLSIFTNGVLSAAQGTVFAVGDATVDGSYRGLWGGVNVTAGVYYVSPGMDFRKNGVSVTKAASSGAHIVTWHHEDGVLYGGIDDTRTASMSSAVAGDITGIEALVLLGSNVALLGDLAEVIFYKTALSEANRKLTEQYLANKYGITLPY